ncbi:MAG TPA: DUF4760 domain-containing protein [Allosphingosinicella sp.]|jgi:hypothetical protein
MSSYERASLIVNLIYTSATIMILLVALIQFRHGRRDASIRASIRILQDESESPAIKSSRRVYHEIARGLNENTIGEILQSPDRELEREALRSIANRYEYISIAIQENAMDFKIYKRMWRSSTLHDWDKLKPFISAVRQKQGNPRIWGEFEWLVQQCRPQTAKLSPKEWVLGSVARWLNTLRLKRSPDQPLESQAIAGDSQDSKVLATNTSQPAN